MDKHNFLKNKSPLVIAGIVILVLALHFFGVTKILTRNKDVRTPTSADNAPPGSIHNLPVPEAVAKVRSLVAKNLQISEGLVIVMSAYEREWPNSCLGLGGSNEICLQVITPGYEVTVDANGKEYTYRTNQDGSVIREEK